MTNGQLQLQMERDLAVEVTVLRQSVDEHKDALVGVILDRDTERERAQRLESENSALRQELERLRAVQPTTEQDISVRGVAQLQHLEVQIPHSSRKLSILIKRDAF